MFDNVNFFSGNIKWKRYSVRRRGETVENLYSHGVKLVLVPSVFQRIIQYTDMLLTTYSWELPGLSRLRGKSRYARDLIQQRHIAPETREYFEA